VNAWRCNADCRSRSARPTGVGVDDTDLRMIQGGVAHAGSTASPASEGMDAESADGAE
jgi:hypothetical protein